VLVDGNETQLDTVLAGLDLKLHAVDGPRT
jgi:hypothetical protein